MANEVNPYTNQSLVTLYELDPSPHHCGYCNKDGSTSSGMKF